MKTKKNTSIYIVLAVVFIVIYLLLAAKPLAKEYHYTPVWKIHVSNPIVKPLEEDSEIQPLYFKLGQNLGYFTEDGTITYYKTFPSQAAISDSYCATYTTQNNSIDFFDNRGNKNGTLEASGFPFFIDDSIYVFLPGGASFAKADETGHNLWISESVIPITAFSCSNNATIAGYADGNIKVFNNKDGKNTLTFAPGGSDYPVILGVDVSNDGNFIASISGHEKQRFVLAQKEETQTKILYHRFLETDTNSRTLIHFCDEKNKVFYAYKDYLGIYDIKNNKDTAIKINGQIISIQENNDLVVLLGKDSKTSTYTVYLVEKSNSLEGSFSFKADTAFIYIRNDSLYVGKNDTISKLKITKE